MRPPAALLDAVGRSRLLVGHAEASRGSGDRRSRAKGAGLEFAEYRAFQPGDDIRHFDVRLKARLGQDYIRQYSVHQQLPVTIVVDGSNSMLVGAGEKYDRASLVANLLAYAGLVGGDVVRVMLFAQGRLHSSPWVQGARRLETLVGWLEEQQPGGEGFASAMEIINSGPAQHSLTVLISDWFVGDVSAELASLRSRNHELLGVHIVSAEDEDPARLGTGLMRLVDSETGEFFEISLNATTRAAYRERFASWQKSLRSEFVRQRGRFVAIGVDDDIVRIATRDWRKHGVIS